MNAVSWVHGAAGLSSPTSSPFIISILDGARRLLPRPVKKKQPLTAEMLGALVKDVNEHHSLSNTQTTAAALLAYAGFFCLDELSDLRPIDLKFDKDMVIVW